MAGPMNVDMAVEANTADTATALFDWALKFYDKNPIITSTCLLLLCAVPLATVILVFFFFIQKDRNRHIENKLKIQLKKAEANGSAE